jgi:KUP system potassium uptake protein
MTTPLTTVPASLLVRVQTILREAFEPHGTKLNARTLIALGIVFGDIGTSVLYAFSAALEGAGHKVPINVAAMGIASAIIWSLVITVLCKYVWLVLKADNHGEGGILALLSLVKRVTPNETTAKTVIISLGFTGFLGVAGCAFLFGDGVITPAISVLSAVEGLKIGAPSLSSWVVPITVAILVGLFYFQHRGTAKIGRLFGPIMFVWFTVISLLGIFEIAQHPSVLLALNPMYAFHLLTSSKAVFVGVFGAVFLAITGGEALYADMGHVGRDAIRRAFVFFVLPALVLNYLGQAAVIIANPTDTHELFYHSAPAWMLWPLIAIACAATIIASQALITGLFSLTRQAIQMTLLPRMGILYPSGDYGQIYVPFINWALMFGSIAVVASFKTSDSLAAAYGVAVSGTMLVTTILLYNVFVSHLRMPRFVALALVLFFGTVDLFFFVSNTAKIFEGGWLPLTIAGVFLFLTTTWRSGSITKRQALDHKSKPLDEFIHHCDDGFFQRTPGTTIWPTYVTDGKVPPMLMTHATRLRALSERVVLLTVQWSQEEPKLKSPGRVQSRDLGHGFQHVVLRVGYNQRPQVKAAMRQILHEDVEKAATYMISTEEFVLAKTGSEVNWGSGFDYAYHYACWRAFSLMSKFATKIDHYFELPVGRVLGVGGRVEM